MSKPIIEIQGVGKRYRLGGKKERYLSLRDEIAKWFSPATRRARAAEEEFWALKDVGFSVEPGEAIGIIGRNGAGKSTLLKILSQITPPTEGKITMRGRVGSLLEVGTGFHPELTGRENIYMNGAILGMSRREIARKFDEIVAFAEMEKFLETPVKRYSSGMYVRLAFAVAAHLEPEILVVDEVLAVGDAAFQKKCLGKMGEVAKGGRTILFVSHNMAAVENLCDRVLLVSKGRIARDGDTDGTVAAYLGASEGINGAKGRHIKAVRLIPSTNSYAPLRCGDPIIFEITIDTLGMVFNNPNIGLGIDDIRGTRIATVGSFFATSEIPPLNGHTTVECTIPEANLAPGQYSIKVALDDLSQNIESIEYSLVFEVHPSDYYGTGKLPTATQGAMLLRSKWSSRRDH
jgi:lipopolysaccharide transport system ATP-binding protein